MTLPQIRQYPWYPGQFGVSGSDVQRGLRWAPTGIVLYVDENHPGATAVGDGTNPEYPLTTITQAITNLTNFATAMNVSLEGSVIVVGNEATIAETVIIPPTAPTNCTILGAGSTAHQPTWTAATAAGTALTVRQEGWTIEGITFEAGGEGTSVRLEEVPASDYISYKTTIRNCRFDGLWGGLYGIDFHGAPHRVRVENCEFIEWRSLDGDAFAVYISDTAHDRPLQCRFHNNLFWSNENHVGSFNALSSWNSSVFTGNVFDQNAYIATTVMLDLRGSTIHNIVTGNVFAGTYSNAGGYYDSAGTPGMWVGNMSEDVASPQVGDNGYTVAAPV
jgi:hypothetical protein